MSAILSNGHAAADIRKRSDQNNVYPAPQLVNSDPITHKAKSTAPLGPELNEQTTNASLAFTASAVSDDGVFLDEEKLLEHNTFPIPPEKLIERAKGILRKGLHKCPNDIADDFMFTAPFIGPMDREGFIQTMETLDLDSVIPDMQARIHHMRVDPLEPNRVWFTSRPVGHHLGPLKAGLPFTLARPTGQLIELPPQTSSLQFNDEGKVVGFTFGYVMDRRIGNSGGLGGGFGFLWAIGCPFPYPEGKPWEASWQLRLFNTGYPVLKAFVYLYDRIASFLLPNWMYTAHSRNVP